MCTDRVFPGGKEQPGSDTDPSPPSSAVNHERVELYLYSPYGPYGLYTASVPVQGCTLPFLPYWVSLMFLDLLGLWSILWQFFVWWPQESEIKGKYKIKYINRYKGKANNRNSGSIIFKSWWSFVELFSKQNNGLRILKNMVRISRVKKYQVWKVKEVIQFNYRTLNLDSEGFSIFVHLVMCLCSPCRALLRLLKWPVTFMYNKC